MSLLEPRQRAYPREAARYRPFRLGPSLRVLGALGGYRKAGGVPLTSATQAGNSIRLTRCESEAVRCKGHRTASNHRMEKASNGCCNLIDNPRPNHGGSRASGLDHPWARDGRVRQDGSALKAPGRVSTPPRLVTKGTLRRPLSFAILFRAYFKAFRRGLRLLNLLGATQLQHVTTKIAYRIHQMS